jgi:putative membrane protein
MRYPSFCKINLETVFKICILFGFSLLFIVLVLTKEIYDYLHPRLVPYLIFASLTFLLMIYSLLCDIKRKNRRFSVAPYIVFIIPLIIALTVPAKTITGSNLQYSNSKITGFTSNQNTASVSSPNASDQIQPPATDSNDGDSQQNESHLESNQSAVYSKDMFGSTIILIITDNTIILDDSNFANWLVELENNPSKYVGTKIEYVGYVFKSGDEFQNNEFVAARNMMWCCAADLQLIGCLCQYDKTADLEENSWVKVDGTLSTTSYKGSTVPLITKATVVPADKPATDYVYPS